ncbi:hypothetical protein [Hoeflea poritis]|uniref:Cobalamin biosynthesis protein CobQ n=1 Tax=Hoeflea poritis TaxID=2993659 RepID=A0ABT4VRT5_9HYPH|nr:hypothetical protein [Hoeflea poritis]MDA4847329.1 hypothetical protein [Hoeflea poritis]
MNTQTHVLLAAAILAKPGKPARNTAVIVGALVPDLAIYTLFIWSKIAGIPERRVWSELYYNPPWSDAVTVGNSAPLYILILLIGLLASKWYRPAILLAVFAIAALLHLAADLPVHVDDAHAHLWPLSDWRFRSPVSYWNPNHNGDIFTIVEAGIGIVLSIILWRRFHALWVRALLVLAIVAYLGPPLYFGLFAQL